MPDIIDVIYDEINAYKDKHKVMPNIVELPKPLMKTLRETCVDKDGNPVSYQFVIGMRVIEYGGDDIKVSVVQ